MFDPDYNSQDPLHETPFEDSELINPESGLPSARHVMRKVLGSKKAVQELIEREASFLEAILTVA
ncbi:hypothetical protein J4457_01690 [Candidatus Woesearchaeota archaeon]|nr:hypothetical protein [Candidatus Woesearchaeota archaeon]